MAGDLRAEKEDFLHVLHMSLVGTPNNAAKEPAKWDFTQTLVGTPKHNRFCLHLLPFPFGRSPNEVIAAEISTGFASTCFHFLLADRLMKSLRLRFRPVLPPLASISFWQIA